MTRGDLLDILWRQVESTVFIGRAEWERGLDDWAIEPLETGGTLAFIVLARGPEIHFATLGTGAAMSLRMVRERVQPLIDRHGFAMTRTPKDATRQRRWNEKLGFVVTGEDEFFLHYRIDTPIWARGQQCRS